MEKPLFELRPQLAVAIIPIILLSLIIGLVVGFYLSTFSINLAIIGGASVFVIILFFRLMNLRSRRYLFYKDKVEFYEGFLNIIHQTVNYSRVTDCVFTKTVWDRLFGTGTIRLVTAGHGGYAGYTTRSYLRGGGVGVQYVENPDQVYKYVQELLKSAK